MLRKKIEESIHKSDLKNTGRKLLELIKLNDEDSINAAIKIIAEHQNDPEVINYQKRGQPTPLILACELKKNKIAAHLLATSCVDVNAKGNKGTHALEAALKVHNHKMALQLAHDHRVHINEAGSDGVPPIYIVLRTGKFRFEEDYPIEIAQAMLSRGDIEMNLRYVHEGRQMIAGLMTYKYECKTLLHALMEALKKFKNNAYSTNLEAIKLSYHNVEVVLQLIKDVLATGKIDINAFAEEVSKSSMETSLSKQTALMLAVQLDHPEVVEMLLAAGANTNLRDADGLTAAKLAKRISIDKHGSLTAQTAGKMAEMIKQTKVKESVAASPATMFGAQNQNPAAVLEEYLVPPRPSAPPEEEVLPLKLS